MKPKSSSPSALGVGPPGAPVGATQAAGLSARSGGELADTPSERTAEGWVDNTWGYTDLIWQSSPLRVWTLDQQYLRLWELRESQNCQPQPHTC